MIRPLSPTLLTADLDAQLFDTSEWPLVYGRFPELNESDRVTRILNSLDAILALQQPFVMAWIPPSHDHDDEPHEDEKRSVVWIKQRKADLRDEVDHPDYDRVDKRRAKRLIIEDADKVVERMLQNLKRRRGDALKVRKTDYRRKQRWIEHK